MSYFFDPYDDYDRQDNVPYGSAAHYQSPALMPMQAAPQAMQPQAITSGTPGPSVFGETPQMGGQMNGQMMNAQIKVPTMQAPQSVQNPYYFAGYLRKYIGRDVRVEFLIGTNGPLIDRTGTLLEVGASYIVLRLIRSDDTQVCDLYSIKFVTVYR